MAGRKRPSFIIVLVWGAVTVALFACSMDAGDLSEKTDYEDLTEEVLSCEEAASKLMDCCPLKPPTIKCEDYRHSNGCDSEGHSPALNLHESKCIRRRSCKDLIDSGVCERAMTAHSRGSYVSGTSASTATESDAGEAPNICQ